MSKHTAIPDLSKLAPLTGKNYRRWSQEMIFFFQETGLEHVLIDDSSSKIESTTADSTGLVSVIKKQESSVEDHNRSCRGHILKHLSEKLFDVYVNFHSAKEIWDSLKKKYGSEDEGKKRYITSKWTSFTINEYLPILSQLHDYELIVSKIQAKGMPIDDQLAALVCV